MDLPISLNMKPEFCRLAVLAFLCICFQSKAQVDSNFLHKAMTSANEYLITHPVEKVYLQLDKSYYAAGDNIWFKAYLTTGAEHRLSMISGVLYVEMFDKAGKWHQSIKLPVVEGLTWGDFAIPDTIKPGNYYVRAYTRWMLNAGPDFIFEKKISIGNAAFARLGDKKGQKGPSSTPSAALANNNVKSSKTDIQFFPEGGSMVYGIPSTVAFKAVGGDGLGKSIKGTLLDNDNNAVAEFESTHLGMGVFSFTPADGKTYHAKISTENGTSVNAAFPAPQPNGYVMHVDNADSVYIKLRIGTTKENADKRSEIYLVGQAANGEIKYAARARTETASFDANIRKSKFPTGIARFTLFSPAGEPLNERIVFIDNKDQLKIALKGIDAVAQKMQKVKMDIKVTNAQGEPVAGNFSVAVIDKNSIPADANENNMYSNLLLTSDVKGFVEHPAQYFDPNNADRQQQLDLLLMTQGYRSFAWQSVLAGQAGAPVYSPETALAVQGEVETLGGRPLPDAKVSLLRMQDGIMMQDTTTDNRGQFIFKGLQFTDDAVFTVSAKSDKKKSNVKLRLDSIADPAFKVIDRSEFGNAWLDTVKAGHITPSLNSVQQKNGEIGGKGKVLREVKVTAPKKLQNSSNLNGPGNADQVIMAKDINMSCPTVLNCLTGKLYNVVIGYDEYGVGHPFSRIGKMIVFIDGIKASDDDLDRLPTSMVESVEVLINGGVTAAYGHEGYAGVLLINAKKGNDINFVAAPNVIKFNAKGYYKVRMFYSPKYDHQGKDVAQTDKRSTIYWDPNVATDSNGNASIEFYNASAETGYHVTLEGISVKGDLAVRTVDYQVK